jgi:hypothetical protein
VRQPYDDVIPYWRFSVRLHKADIPKLEEHLGGFDEERITALQYGLMKCAPYIMSSHDPINTFSPGLGQGSWILRSHCDCRHPT